MAPVNSICNLTWVLTTSEILTRIVAVALFCELLRRRAGADEAASPDSFVSLRLVMTPTYTYIIDGGREG